MTVSNSNSGTVTSEVLIAARGLGKRFRMYEKPSGRWAEWLSFGKSVRHKEFWALRDFSMELRRGRCVGIIGANGAGKSTLLRILSGTLSKSEGEFEVNGKVLSLLELGTGFNVNLTGRENILHTGELLGYSPVFMAQTLPRIEEFAELGDFFDRPLRVYSSGMHVRLGFAMFASLSPEILIVDEALAVGDVSFQRKCFRRMEELIEDQTKAVLLVAHDMAAIQKLCDEVIWLDHGRVRMKGEAREVIDHYLRFMFTGNSTAAAEPVTTGPKVDTAETSAASMESLGDSQSTIPTSGLLNRVGAAMVYPSHGAELLGVWVENAQGQAMASVGIEEDFRICYAVKFNESVEDPVFGVRLVTTRGEVLFATNTLSTGTSTRSYAPGETQVVAWPVRAGLGVGDYFISCGCSSQADPHRFYMREVDGYSFSIAGSTYSKGLCSLIGKPQLKGQS